MRSGYVMVGWSGHSCPLALSMLRASGQECPLHPTKFVSFSALRLRRGLGNILRLRDSCNLGQFLRDGFLHTQERTVIYQHFGGAAKQWLIGALIGRRTAFAGRAASQRNRRLAKALKPNSVHGSV